MTATLQAISEASEQRQRLLLPRVSRTFALGIKLLPPRLERPVRTGYLLCRIADTIEDDLALPASRRADLLTAFLDVLDDEVRGATFGEISAELTGAADHRELVALSADVFATYRGLDDQTRAILRHWVVEMVTGMRAFTLAYPNGLRLASLDEFRRYCYYVAGTVGHLLTELWRVHSTAVNEHVYARLLVDCEAFGETLQTVNIIKDIAWDAERENAIYVPADLLAAAGSAQHQILSPQYRGANRVAIEPLLTLAKDDLERALEYICTIPPTAVRIRLFCALPMLFAAATLRELDQSDAMLVPGGGVKITRDEVRSIVFAASTSTLTNGSLRWLVRRIRRRPFLLGRR